MVSHPSYIQNSKPGFDAELPYNDVKRSFSVLPPEVSCFKKLRPKAYDQNGVTKSTLKEATKWSTALSKV